MLTRFYSCWHGARVLAIAIAVLFAILVTISLNAWEDHPDKEDVETAKLFRLAQKQTGAHAYEQKLLEQQAEEALLHFKDSKFKKKVPSEDSD